MESLRGKYRVSYHDHDVRVGTSSAVFTQTFVAKSLRREERRDDGLNGFRGAVHAVLISLAFWAAIGVALLFFS